MDHFPPPQKNVKGGLIMFGFESQVRFKVKVPLARPWKIADFLACTIINASIT